jgi:hypothetical protein
MLAAYEDIIVRGVFGILEVCSTLSSESSGTDPSGMAQSTDEYATMAALLLCCCAGTRKNRRIGCCSLQVRHQGVRRSDDASFSGCRACAIGINQQVTLALGERKPCRHKLDGKPYRASVGSRETSRIYARLTMIHRRLVVVKVTCCLRSR